MKQYQINKAYAVLNHIANTKLRVRDSYNIYMLLKKLEPAYMFELDQERKLVEKYDGVIGTDGIITIGDAHKLAEFKAEINELNNLETDIDLSPICINCDALEDIRLSPYEMACLDGFVDFV